MNQVWAGFKGGCDWLEKLAIVMTALGMFVSLVTLSLFSFLISIPVAVALVRLAGLRGQALGAGSRMPEQVQGSETTGTIAPPPPVKDEPPEDGWY